VSKGEAEDGVISLRKTPELFESPSFVNGIIIIAPFPINEVY